MYPTAETITLDVKLERVGSILRLVGWLGFWLELGLAATASLMLTFAVAGRNFNQAVAMPAPGTIVDPVHLATTPGIGIGIFWAVCGIVALLFSIYLAYRETRFAKRLLNSNSTVHPQKREIIQLLRLGAIVGFIGMLLAIFGSVTTLSILLAKSISTPQGVALYDPTRVIRSLDIFVAFANVTMFTAHFSGTVASASLFEWMHR